MLYEKRSKKADEEYEQQLQMVVRKLVKEYESLFGSQYDAAGEVDDVQVRPGISFPLLWMPDDFGNRDENASFSI